MAREEREEKGKEEEKGGAIASGEQVRERKKAGQKNISRRVIDNVRSKRGRSVVALCWGDDRPE